MIEWVHGVVQQAGGEVLESNVWGRRRLAYPVEHELEGTYVLATFRLPPEGTRALESALRISEDVMRHILIRGIIPYEGGADAGRSGRAAAPAEERGAASAPGEGAGDEAAAPVEAEPQPAGAVAD